MLFNSLDFAIFLPTVFILYWMVFRNSFKRQNILLVLASYVFYGWWDWRFLSLILFSTLVDFWVGLQLGKNQDEKVRRGFLTLSVLVNLGFLGFFKYYNFFVDNFREAFSFLGYQFEGYSLSIVLPVGISFYTFQTMSYTIDLYRKKLQPTADFIAFSAFISFFPQLVAGPIERATHLLPQFYQPRNFDYGLAISGVKQIIWGLFKKMVIADNAAVIVNAVFANEQAYNGSALWLGAIFFALQIYGDFSGYSDIAIGTARLFGFDLMKNFAFPYFSRDVAEFWRRWHISLSTWFRDYLYIPLGGSKGNNWLKIRNTFIIFLVSGFWHGANWTFLAWGLLNALYFLPSLLSGGHRRNLDTVAKGRKIVGIKEGLHILVTFMLITIAWVLFRAENMQHAWNYLKGMFSFSVMQMPNLDHMQDVYIMLGLIFFFVWMEWRGREREFAISHVAYKLGNFGKWAVYSGLVLLIYIFGNTDVELEFIYFQF